MTRLRRIIPVLVAVFVAGCGSKPPSEADRVRSTISDYVRLQAEGETADACALLTGAGRRQLVTFVAQKAKSTPLASDHLTCERAIEIVRLVAGSGLLADLRDAEVRDVAVQGDGATAVLVGGGDVGRRTVRLAKVGGAWRIRAVPGLGG